jgi:hypothetical protein
MGHVPGPEATYIPTVDDIYAVLNTGLVRSKQCGFPIHNRFGKEVGLIYAIIINK